MKSKRSFAELVEALRSPDSDVKEAARNELRKAIEPHAAELESRLPALREAWPDLVTLMQNPEAFRREAARYAIDLDTPAADAYAKLMRLVLRTHLERETARQSRAAEKGRKRKLPAAAELQREFRELRRECASDREARAKLHRRYLDATPSAINKKLRERI